MERKPIIGGLYRHFKANVYQVKLIAKDSTTTEDIVVYQAMYPPYTYWTRTLKEFVDIVDHKKYPEIRQQYRFERISADEVSSVAKCQRSEDIIPFQTENANISGKEYHSEESTKVDDQMFLRALTSGRPADYLKDKMSEEEIASRGLLQILDAQTFREKRQLLIGLRPYLNRIMIENIAVALDIVLEDGSEEEQVDSILRCLQTQEHYEGGRLR